MQKTIKSAIQRVASEFQQKISTGPIFPCASCNRALYRHSVTPLSPCNYGNASYEEKLQILGQIHAKYYNKNSKVSLLAHQEIMAQVLSEGTVKSGPEGKLYICDTCQRALKRSQVPTQAVANSLKLDPIPEELSDLNDLEVRLVAQRTPFMKLVALPKGRQHAIHGPCVNVPATMKSICTLLPRLPDTAQVVPLQFKRRLRYRSNYMFKHIRPSRVLGALRWLKNNNPLYKDVTIAENWRAQWAAQEPDLFQAMMGSTSNGHSSTSSSGRDEHNSSGSPVSEASAGQHIQTSVSDPVADEHPKTCNSRTPLSGAEAHEPYSSLDVGAPIVRCSDLQSCSHDIPGLAQFVRDTPLEFRKEAFNLAHIVHDMGLAIINPSSSHGSCLYAALSVLLPSVGHAAIDVSLMRQNLSCYLRENPSWDNGCYADFLLAENAQQRASLWEAYLHGVQTTSWGDNIAIVGLANMYGINLRVISASNPHLEPITPHNRNSSLTVNLGLIAEYHYVALPIVDEDLIADATESSTIEQELEGFDAAAKVRGLPLDTCLQKEDLIYSVAPSEDQTPISILEDSHFEELAYPDSFPFGTGGFSSISRTNKNLTPRKYFNQRILNIDGRFASNIEYLLAAQYATESKDVQDHVRIAMRQVYHSRPRNQVTAATVRDVSSIETMIGKDNAFRFLATVRGTPSYWQRLFHDVLAMQRQIGIPTWFLTLSAADLQWPDVITCIAQQKGQAFTTADISQMTWAEKTMWLRTNPVTAARHFQHRLDAFFSVVLRSDAQPLGNISDHVIRIEFQARGSPHAHCILWSQDAPKLDKDPDEHVTQFIDRYQHGFLPTDDTSLRELVEQRQTHVHNQSCLIHGSCRFHIPKPVAPRTVIAREPKEDKTESLRAAKEVLKQVHDVTSQLPKDSTMSTEEILAHASVSQETYIDALRVNKTGVSIVLQRQHQDCYVNNYNPDVLNIWGANMDLQYIVNPWACIIYITSYMLKTEKTMGELLKQTALEHKNETIKTQMRKLGTRYLNNREVSAQESVYRMLSLPLKKSTRQVIFVNSGPPEDRVKILKPKSVLETLEDDDADIYCSNLIDRYTQRPASVINLCLADFATCYRVSYSNAPLSTDEQDPDLETDRIEDLHADLPRHFSLASGQLMQKRRRQCILRTYIPNLTKFPEKHYRSKLFLYYPWRDELTDLKGNCNTYEEYYYLKLRDVQANEARFNGNSAEIDDALQNVDATGPPEHVWARIAPGAEQAAAEQNQEPSVPEREVADEDLRDNERLLGNEPEKESQADFALRYRTQRNPAMLSAKEYNKMMQDLNGEQQVAVFHHQRWCKETVSALKHGRDMQPYRLFISGPGGVGKSHVIKLLHQDTIRILKKTTFFDSDDTIILLTAPTGTAAFGIGGMTIHSALCFSAFSSSLSADKLNSLRVTLEKLSVIIIDEISMVSSDMLEKINQRLQLIKQTDKPFGNVTVIAVGDLFQLKPVEGKFIFQHSSHKMNHIVCPDTLFSTFDLLELEKVMRQKDDQEFAQMLCRIREGKTSPSDIAVLQEQSAHSAPPRMAQVTHTFATNKKVKAHNTKVLNSMGTHIWNIPAIDSAKDVQTNLLDHTVEEELPISKTGNLESHLQICVNARVIITTNIDVSDGLVNGSTGHVIQVISNQNSVNCILVKLESKNAGVESKRTNQYRQTFPGTVAIVRQEVHFPINKSGFSSRASKTITIRRRQFPLALAWGCTIHKMQGMTVKNIVVDMSGRFSPGQAYVALSRVKTLSGLFITNFDAKKITFNPTVSEALSSMNQLKVNLNPYADSPGLLIGHLNVRGFSPHQPDINAHATIQRLDCFCMTETHLAPSDRPLLHLPWTEGLAFRYDRDSSGGGVMICSKSHCTRIHHIDSPLEIVTITHPISEEKLVYITTIYRRPALSSQLLIYAIKLILQDIPMGFPHIILGDFNEDLLTKTTPLKDFMTNEHGFTQLINQPTTDYGSLLDHIYLNNITSKAVSHVQDIYFTDHDLTLLHIPS